MFGLIGHSTSLEHAQTVADKLGYPEYADQGLEFWCSAPPQIADRITVTSLTGQTIEGRYVESCFLPEMLSQRRIKAAVRKVLNAMAHAQKHGLNITALGGFSSIMFENFNLHQNQRVRNVQLEFERFTTGNTYTAYVIARQVEWGLAQLGLDLAQATVAVCGATGDIGSAVCRWLSARAPAGELLLVARDRQRLEALQGELGGGRIASLEAALPQADALVWVTSMPEGIELDPAVLPKPCLIVDGGYPKNLAARLQHPEVRALKGGVVEHTLGIDSQILQLADVDVPGRQLFACFAESMVLEFEKRYTNFSWGRNRITLDSMDKIGRWSAKHGFQPVLS
ncbi:MAG: long-chain acyl-[acyl-carrier-protein] reductase [Cyanobacteria bacterium QS_8_64_29]|nr:MAG: long-chain acyl-[acyl-carrier-protein] reductase [Cyanobacteria bacterium QS_8_64_29]